MKRDPHHHHHDERFESVISLIDVVGMQNPSASAIASEHGELTYRELLDRSTWVAARLNQAETGSGDRIGVLVSGRPELAVACLGTWRAGAAVVPADPVHPQARLHTVFADAGIRRVLTCAEHAELVAELGLDPWVLDIHADQFPFEARLPRLRPHDLAYITYTSGTTGVPKGVAVEHAGLGNLAHELARLYNVDATSRVLHFSSPSFDASIADLVTTLVAGATLCIVDRDQLLPRGRLEDTVSRFSCTHVTMPPSVLAVTQPEDFPSLTHVVSAGEACSQSVADRWAPRVQFRNGYGPTETTVCAMVHQFREPGERVSLGQPLVGVDVYVVDGEGDEVPAGEAGELTIAGVGLARGYWGRPGLTASSFRPLGFGDRVGERVYHTGDIVREGPNGRLEFLGRRDLQVKVAGHRIELGEVEAVAKGCLAVADVAITMEAVGGGRLVAYVVPAEGAHNVVEALSSFLAKLLPKYMVPVVYRILSNLPLTTSGKCDREQLQRMLSTDVNQLDVGGLEAAILAIWSSTLGSEAISATDSFLDAGGTSLAAANACAQIEASCGVALGVDELLEHPSARLMACYLAEQYGVSHLAAPTDGESTWVEGAL